MKMKLLGLAALGGAYYAHRQRGGVLTMDSIKESFGILKDKVSSLLGPVEEKKDDRIEDRSSGGVSSRANTFTPHRA